MFATLGVKVTLLDQRPLLLEFADREITESLCFQLRQLGTVFRLGEKVVSVGFDQERDRATEIVHIGQAVLTMGGTIEYFRDTVFNYPTLAEAYKVAALDGLNKL